MVRAQVADAALNRLTEFVIKKAFLDWEVMASAGCSLHLAVNAPETPAAAPPAANRLGNGLPFWRSTRALVSTASPPCVWNSAPVTLMAQ